MIEHWGAYCDRYRLTPTEAKFFAVLADGASHDLRDIGPKALGVQFVEDATTRCHVHRIRKKVKPHGVRIITVVGGYRAFIPKEVA